MDTKDPKYCCRYSFRVYIFKYDMHLVAVFNLVVVKQWRWFIKCELSCKTNQNFLMSCFWSMGILTFIIFHYFYFLYYVYNLYSVFLCEFRYLYFWEMISYYKVKLHTKRATYYRLHEYPSVLILENFKPAFLLHVSPQHLTRNHCLMKFIIFILVYLHFFIAEKWLVIHYTYTIIIQYTYIHKTTK